MYSLVFITTVAYNYSSIERLICASLNHRKRMELVESSR